MAKKLIIINNSNNTSFYLETITSSDIELLRTWKNKHRSSFFYQKIISPEQQQEWYKDYCTRDDDYIFVLKSSSTDTSIGCLGFRLQTNEIDLYNIIRGNTDDKSLSMHDAMYVMLNFITQNYTTLIKCDVLKDNPAVKWYLKCGFAIQAEKEYYVMCINEDKIPKIDLLIEEE